MPHGLLVGFPAHGHMGPLLALAEELVEAGDDLTVMAAADWQEQAVATGAGFRPFLNDFRLGPDQLPEAPVLLMGAALQTLHEQLDWVRQASFDYIVHDSLAHGGRLLASAVDVPSICSMTTFVLTPRVLALARGIFRPPPSVSFSRKARALLRALGVRRRIRDEFGLTGPRLRELIGARSPLNIVYTSRRFQPLQERFGAEFRFVGPARLSEAPAEGQRRLVFVSLGTFVNRDEALFRHVFDGLRPLGLPVVATTGRGLPVERLRLLAPGVEVHEFVDQQAILGRASAAVTRGGLNTVSECIGAGVPALIVPELAEQAVVARRAAECGTGLYLRRRDVTAGRVGEAVGQLLSQPAFSESCARLAADFRRCGGAARAARLVRAFVEGTG